jgi:hypothetical protein
MRFAGINYLAVIVAAVAAFAFGAAYYSLLSKPWLRATRIDPTEMKRSPAPFIVSFVGELIMAWMLAGVLGHLGPGQVTLWNGVVSAFFIWLGFMATTTAIAHRYQGYGWDLTIIDAGHWLGVALVMGAIIGWWGA